MKSAIFRQVSLDRLSSPEQLDQLLAVTGARTWVAMAAILAILVAAVVWGFEGRVMTTAAGTGVIIRQGGVLNIVTSGAGVVISIAVKPGTSVKANQVIATIAQPALQQQISLLVKAREEAITDRDQNLKSDTDAAQLKNAANSREHANVVSQISELQERSKLLAQQVSVEQQLYAKGLVTNQQVLDMKQKLISMNDDIDAANAHLKQLDADRFVIAAQPEEDNLQWRTRVTDLDRQITSANQRLELARNVVSPYDGEVLEIKTSPGSTVAEAQPVVSIQPRQESLEVLAYIPSLLAKDLRVGMDTEVSPSNVKREEYGFMRGRLDYVADFPATDAAIMRNFENDALVRALSESGPVTEIRATLTKDASTSSGFAWSTSKGPEMFITSGTICQVDVVTRREKPISLVFPYLKSKLGY
jgi:HlyD family secretion protein